MSQSCSSDPKSSDDSSGAIEESSSDRKLPLHLRDHDGNYNSKCDNVVISSSSSNIGCILNSAAIAVKEAKIDPIRWIQYVTGSNPQQYANQIGKTPRRKVSNNSNSGNTGTRGGGQSNLRLCEDNKRDSIQGISCCSNGEKSQQNEAIEFELSITFNGRKYTAKRTMQCIMQLRDDLIKETKRRRQWLTQTEDLSTSTDSKLTRESSNTGKYDGRLRFNQFSHFDVTQSSSDKLTTKPEQDKKQSCAIQIPEIPPFTSGHDRRHMSGDTGFVGKGFTMLHAMVKSYVPAMESWLKNVMEIVPQDSECLMNFLWEPATDLTSACFKSVLDSVNNGDQMWASNKFKSSTSLATLGSIKEMDYDTEDDDSEDGPDVYSADGWKEQMIFGNTVLSTNT